jgi:hypothetical protein
LQDSPSGLKKHEKEKALIIDVHIINYFNQNLSSAGIFFTYPTAIGSKFSLPNKYQEAEDTHGKLSAPCQRRAGPYPDPRLVA